MPDPRASPQPSATTEAPAYTLPEHAPLVRCLRAPLTDHVRTRFYQACLDATVDHLRTEWDVERGLIGTAGMDLPHEQIGGYWQLSAAERAARTDPRARAAYDRNAGRAGTSPLAVAAFCWYSPLSRHRGDPDLLRYFANGLHHFAASVGEDGAVATAGLNGGVWAHGWDVEGLIYGLVFAFDGLQHAHPAAIPVAIAAFRRAATRAQHITDIGTYGNQRCVHALGLYNYGQILQDETLIALGDRHWRDALPKVLDATGQVVEQHGPCMHYSYTAFIYAWLNLAVRGDRQEDERVLNCLRWFTDHWTRSMDVIAAPSARKYTEQLGPRVVDLLPAAEQLARRDPAVRDRIDRALLALARQQGQEGASPEAQRLIDLDPSLPRACGHGASPLVWAMLVSEEDDHAERVPSDPDRTMEAHYRSATLLKRAPMPYVLVHHRYQTHYNFRCFLPLAGLQSWALGEEPPIIHPTPLAPSTTRGEGLDTARQGTSHNWGLYGAGAMALDGRFHPAANGDELSFLVARFDWLWQVVCFTELSTVLLEFGAAGPRQHWWTLNRLAPAEPCLAPRVVRFADRRACLHTTLPTPPRLVERQEDHEWARGVRQLEYERTTSPAAFAFSNDSFTFAPDAALEDRRLRFADAAGRYELILHEKFFLPENPGNFSVDPFELAQRMIARRVD